MHYTDMPILNVTVPMVPGGGEIPYVFEELTSMPHPQSSNPATETNFEAPLQDNCQICHIL